MGYTSLTVTGLIFESFDFCHWLLYTAVGIRSKTFEKNKIKNGIFYDLNLNLFQISPNMKIFIAKLMGGPVYIFDILHILIFLVEISMSKMSKNRR